MIDRTLVRQIDWILIFLLIFNSLIGVLMIESSSQHLSGNFMVRQLIWMLFSILVLFIMLGVGYATLINFSPTFYFLCIAALLGILIFGNLIAGTKSWIRMPFFQIQPSEITKIAVILLLSRIFVEFRKTRMSLFDSALAGGVVFFPVLLIALQPDLGTAMSFLPILLGAVILAGINRKHLILILLAALLLGASGWQFFLKDYQKERISTLLFPSRDPLGSGYHLIQSKIAVGSGGFLGKGYKKGSQSQLRFLPARHTDFIFSVIGEELGFVGVVVVLISFGLLLFRIFQTVLLSRDRAGIYLTFMVFMLLASQFFINILMTVGLFPVAGIPLPLLSYGGSSLLTNYIAVSLVLNVRMRRFVNV